MQDAASSVAPGASAASAPLTVQVDPTSQRTGGGTDMASGLFSTALSLAFVLVLAWVVLRVVKRVQQGKAVHGQDAVQTPQVLHSLSLGPNQRLITIQYGGRQYLLGVTAAAIQLLDAGQNHPEEKTRPVIDTAAG